MPNGPPILIPGIVPEPVLLTVSPTLGPIGAGGGLRGTMADVTAAVDSTTRITLVARRHVDFKRTCTCCCLP
ncbi:Ms4527A family Cys-rich leader peptide [Mycolicibacterium diernhoferi]|uniref:Ms4527A family Cys-rich leader peptide n=1 Tax=Mycolicibacterium diernhoferi TaxID=1801 RepID=UPI00399AA8FF